MTQQMSKWTKKQAGVIYRAFKSGELTISESTISEMYDLVNDGFGIDYNGEANREIALFKTIVDHIFNGETDKAQAVVDRIEGNVAETAEAAEETDGNTYTTTTGITYTYEEVACGFSVNDGYDEEIIEDIETEAELFEQLEKMNAWRAA